MNEKRFQTLQPNIVGNSELREPQIKGFEALQLNSLNSKRELALVIPVGCGKSGLITLTPFAFKSRRTLVIAPGLKLADQLCADFAYDKPTLFYRRFNVLSGPVYPEPSEIRGLSTNRSDLDAADVVITNIHQVAGDENKWLTSLPDDYFDLIIFDEAHHDAAESWTQLKKKFPKAKIVGFSATPTRADGKLMSGEFIYSFPVARAIELGYVKRLKALVLNPRTLKYVREDNQEVEVSLEEVRKLGEEDAKFRRSIVTSKETLDTIVNASIGELYRLRSETSDNRHKIIAAALNYAHCIQVTEAYKARGLRAAFVHSREKSITNDRILAELDRHELDVIVQVRKLGEGFDHKYLSVAAIFAVFSHLSPFVQFVGRVMRAIDQNNPTSVNNRATVVYHAGANVARLWDDFKAFSTADQEYYEQLLPEEQLDFSSGDELIVEPRTSSANPLVVRSQSDIQLEQLDLLDDEEARRAFDVLVRKGMTPERFASEYVAIQPTRQTARRAAQDALNSEEQLAVGGILRELGISHEGRTLDKRFIQSNYEYVISKLKSEVNRRIGHKSGERGELSPEEILAGRNAIRAISSELREELANG